MEFLLFYKFFYIYNIDIINFMEAFMEELNVYLNQKIYIVSYNEDKFSTEEFYIAKRCKDETNTPYYIIKKENNPDFNGYYLEQINTVSQGRVAVPADSEEEAIQKAGKVFHQYYVDLASHYLTKANNVQAQINGLQSDLEEEKNDFTL